MGQITATRNLVATKVVRLAGQQDATLASSGVKIPVNVKMSASMGSSIIQSRSWHEYSGSNEPEQWDSETVLNIFGHLFCEKPLSESVLIYYQLYPWEQNLLNFIKIGIKTHLDKFHLLGYVWKISSSLQNVGFLFKSQCVNAQRPRQNGRHFTDGIRMNFLVWKIVV